MATMTKESLAAAVKEQDGWDKPEYNDQLYLQCKGFQAITEAIGEYTNVKALWLQQNALSKIENLQILPQLGCLFLHQNCIRSLEGLQGCKGLHTLNISNNYITKITGLAGIPLETLQMSHNRLSTLADLEGIKECTTLGTLDISHNTISADKEKGEKSEDLIDILRELPALKCVYLQGNEISGQTRYWRRKVVGGLKELTYMDERPVFDEERRAVDAWMVGGFEAEQAERDKMRAEKDAEHKEHMRKWKAMQEKTRPIREAREKEYQLQQEEQAAWRRERALVHTRARKECENEFMDVRAELWHLESQVRSSDGPLADEKKERADALRRQEAREEVERTEREALADIEREEQEREERRRVFQEELQTQQLSLQQELEFLQREEQMTTDLESCKQTAALEEIDRMALEGPAPVESTTERPARRTAHVDPSAPEEAQEDSPPRARAQLPPRDSRAPGKPFKRSTVEVWARYAQWENALRR